MSDYFGTLSWLSKNSPSRVALPEVRRDMRLSNHIHMEGNITNFEGNITNFSDKLKDICECSHTDKENCFHARMIEYRLNNPTAAELVAERNETAQQVDAATRYQSAQSFGPDFATHISSKIDRDYNAEVPAEDTSNKPRARGETFTHTTAQGTVIGIDRVNAHSMRDNNTIQITRMDGLQLNFELTEDMRITDLEDGSLSIYYAATGISRVFDAEGKESTVQGEMNALGTSGDDLISNVKGKRVDAGDGDDTIIHFADGATILGGAGNDKIYLASMETTGLTVDGGAGDDAIEGEHIHNSKIVMEDGTDSLTAFIMNRSNITSSGNNKMNLGIFSDGQFVSRNGLLYLKIQDILNSSVSIERAKPMSADIIRRSHLSFGGGDVILSAFSISDTRILTGGGYDMIRSNWLRNSFINTNGGDDTIEVKGTAIDSTVFSGNGKDTVNIYENFDSHVY